MPKIKKILKKINPTTLKPIKSSYALENAFYKKLKKLTDKINRSVLYWSSATFNNNINKNLSKQLVFNFNDLLTEWDKRLKPLCETLASRNIKEIEKYANTQFKSQNISFNFKRRNKNINNQLLAGYERQLGLIKSLPNEIINNYKNFFLNNVGNLDREALYKQFRIIGGISNRRAKLIARDQTQKAVNAYTQARAEALGFNYYQWSTAGDSRVSREHKHLNGRIYKYGEPTAIIDSYGNIGKPGDRVNCRCLALSIIIQPGQEVKKVSDSVWGDYYILIEK